ncbi:hypothetical protein FJTKL_13798 [Diaporthe vaccinii]|uniref:Uncharacterized protein n=1 Tax=Diaporthe vaccinii TaxID=105482 RepID=A0ABR4F9D0_9PEZI
MLDDDLYRCFPLVLIGVRRRMSAEIVQYPLLHRVGSCDCPYPSLSRTLFTPFVHKKINETLFFFFSSKEQPQHSVPCPFILYLSPRQPEVLNTAEHPRQSDPSEVRLKPRLPTRPGTLDRPTIPDFACPSTFLVFPLSVNRCVLKQLRRRCSVLGLESNWNYFQSRNESVVASFPRKQHFQTRPRPRVEGRARLACPGRLVVLGAQLLEWCLGAG